MCCRLAVWRPSPIFDFCLGPTSRRLLIRLGRGLSCSLGLVGGATQDFVEMATSTLTLTLALDFLSVEGVVEAKLVSKAARSAARTVLTRGRYQPVARCFVLMNRLGDLPSTTYYEFTEEDMKIIRAAWSLEPAIVAAEGILIPRKGDIICEIFDILEPSLDGLERLVAAWEHVSIEESQPWSSQSDIFCSHFQGWISRRTRSQVVLSNPHDQDQRIQTLKDARDRFWRAVERWSDLPRIVKAVYPWCGEDKEGTRASVATSRYWTDVVKIDFVVAAIRAFENERVELELSRGDHW